LISLIRNLSIKAQLTILCVIILVPLLRFQGLDTRGNYRALYEQEVQANLEIVRAARTMFLAYVNNLLRAETAMIVGLTQHEHTF
jgi:hypothetical protein